MTSKEALKELVYYSTLDDSGFEATMKDYAKIIENDLKVLEIFKKLDFEIYENGGGENWNWYLDFYHSNKMTEEEIEIIKEWLENDN